MATFILVGADRGILLYFVVLNSLYALLLILSIPELWEQWRIADDSELSRLRGSDVIPPLSVLVPAYNEEKAVSDSLLSFVTLEYPRHEVIVINDGSTDGTMQQLIDTYDLYEVPPAFPRPITTQPVRAYYRSRRQGKLLCIDKENGGKADALNAGLNAAHFPYVLAVDADTVIEPDALLRMVRPFTLGVEVAAVGGTVRVANGSRVQHARILDPRVDWRPLAGFQTVEYLRAFLFGRLGWNRLGGSLIISGAFGLFRRDYLLGIEGYTTRSVTEDMDLVVRLRKYLCDNGIEAELSFIPDPVAWTEVPSSVRVLSAQRERWHRGLIATLVGHRDLMFNRRYGSVGFIAFPFFVLGEMLAPLVELFGYVGFGLGLWLGVIDRWFALMFLAASVGYGFILSLWAILLEEVSFRRYSHFTDLLKLLMFAALEPFGYRQLTLVVRCWSFVNYLRRKKGWGEMIRRGLRQVEA
ncbi:MAG: glycosyltransferase family 2 protein [Gemmatimonadaceae bacterium]|nr:glycosyltransferase family 2 protein [Gemmatimonadaceae bacterium]